MNIGRTVFSQLMDLLPLREFRKCIARYRGNYKVQCFSCLDQFLCRAFAQLYLLWSDGAATARGQ